ncbi:class I SAM-dependent methyltransferase [Pseudomonas putida]|uniref:Methyltransferase domain-containing protein n=1 Tax=Pseudomonas putida TaxID=303 RepID=A0A1Q9R056_PSEPU|nr:class I SAM-dependent methyltransferase [Pseudomonas putida]OLS60766.1 hypothetical protein PSEMO_43580 [Pseudomonas putida]
MHNDELKALFDQQAAGYDQQWAGMAPIRDNLHFLLGSLFTSLPDNARILAVGAGTGAEIGYLAARNPGWRFIALDPSGAMLEVCRERAQREGFLERCDFHEGYLENLDSAPTYDASTCFLVSQFFLDPAARSTFFGEIAQRLKPGGLLASADLSADTASPAYDTLLHAWMSLMSSAGVQPEALERARAAYARDVAILPREQVARIIEAGGFSHSLPFFQAGLMHGWISRR